MQIQLLTYVSVLQVTNVEDDLMNDIIASIEIPEVCIQCQMSQKLYLGLHLTDFFLLFLFNTDEEDQNDLQAVAPPSSSQIPAPVAKKSKIRSICKQAGCNNKTCNTDRAKQF